MTQPADAPAQPSNDLDVKDMSTQLSLRLQKLQLESFRGFDTLTIDFPAEGPSVFIGVNGCGKSSILDAIAMHLRSWTHAIFHEAFDHELSQARASDVKERNRRAVIAVSMQTTNATEQWSIQIRSDTPSGTLSTAHVSIKELRNSLADFGNNSVPVLCHYPATRRLGDRVSDKNERVPLALVHPNELDAYLGALAGGFGPFGDFVQWFRNEEDSENETRLRIDNAYRNPRLEVVRRALQQFLEVLSGGAPYTDMRMERIETAAGRRAAKKNPELVIDKDGVRLSIAQLSEGEKNTLLMVADLASRLGIANPGSKEPLLGNGIVLIDEVDLHLHPAWQRELIPALGKTFPGCQFIVTTHSAQVLGRVPKDNVFILENFQLVRNRPHTYGRDANSILGEVMGVPERPKDIEELIRTASRLVDEERLDEAKAALKNLADAVGDDDSMVVRIRTLMSFLG